MRILRIIARLNVGGPARHVVWLTSELQKEGFETRLIAGTVPDGEEDMEYFAADHGVKPIFIEELSRELSPRDVVALFKIYREIKRFGPDVVHTHTAKAGTIGRMAAFVYRWLTWRSVIGKPRPVRIFHTFHGHVFHSYYGKWKTRLFLGIEKLLAFAATDKIVVITKQQFDEIHNKFGVGDASQIRIIPLGIDLSQFERSEAGSFRKELNVAANELLIGFVGRLTEIKNLSLYINAIALYSRQKEDLPKARFLIVGDGHLRGPLEEQVRTLGLANDVTFVGSRADIPDVYAALDIIALTSLNEGTPLSLIEAMAANRPVIATGVGGVVDLLGGVVEDRGGFKLCERGVRVDRLTPEDFLTGLSCLMQDESLRRRTAMQGRIFAHANYDKRRLVDDIKALYTGAAPTDMSHTEAS